MNWNFALILFVLLVITGVVYGLDFFWLRRARATRVAQALALAQPSWVGLPAEEVALRTEQIRLDLGRMNWFVEYAVSFFPVILFVFALRSFVVEPFRIPSGSMLPTLQSGDLILVNKFTYGIRLPIIDQKIIPLGSPKRGDVMVFKYPVDPTLDYIKRVVGIPGDKVVYRNKRLSVNGKDLPYEKLPDYLDEERLTYFTHLREDLTGVSHQILNDDRLPGYVPSPDAFPQHELCSYNLEGFECVVPAGHYFMMGDNRDNSLDSRYWGFVPDQNIVGKAFFVWMNLGDLKRIGPFK
jgi:signal peptidase I